MLGRHARARHDGGGRGQPQRARAGNHQHRHGADQCHLHAHARPPPAQQGTQRNQQHHGHKDVGHLVHQPLYRCLGGLRILHQPDDAREHRLRAHRTHLQHDAALAVDGAARQAIALRLGHGQRLARQHGFVHLRVALQQHAIDGDALAGAHHQPVAHHHLGHGHIDLAGFAQQVRHIGPQAVQGADGRRGLVLGACLQPLAQQHQRDDHRRRLEVQVRRVPRVGGEPQPHRQAPARTGANGHQQIHVAR